MTTAPATIAASAGKFDSIIARDFRTGNAIFERFRIWQLALLYFTSSGCLKPPSGNTAAETARLGSLNSFGLDDDDSTPGLIFLRYSLELFEPAPNPDGRRLHVSTAGGHSMKRFIGPVGILFCSLPGFRRRCWPRRPQAAIPQQWSPRRSML